MQPGLKTVILTIVTTMLVLLVACTPQNSQPGEMDSRALKDAIAETGYSSVSEWLDALTDEQAAMVNLAYEADVASGYASSKDEWASSKVKVRKDAAGDTVVMLPDGGQFSQATNNIGDGTSGALQPGANASSDSAGSENPDDRTAPNGAPTVDQSRSSQAASQGTMAGMLSVDSADAHPGDNDVVVNVSVKNNPGILGLDFSVSYDEGALSLIGADNGAAVKDVLSMTRSRSLASGCHFAWDGVSIAPEQVSDGSILTLHFSVSSDAQPGAYAVVLRSVSALDNNLGEIVLAVEDGGVIVG